MKRNRNRLPALVLAGIMLLSIFGAPLYAEEPETGAVTVCPHHVHDEACGYSEDSPCTFDPADCELCNPINGNETKGSQAPAECTCQTPCTEGSIQSDCPVCSAEGAALAQVCKGKEPRQDEQEQSAPAAGPALLSADGEGGVAPQTEEYDVTVTPATVDFGTVNASDLGGRKQVTVTNTGNVTNTVRPPESDAYTITGVTGFEEGVAQLLSQETASFTVQSMAGLAVKEYSGDLSLSGSGNSQVTINATCVLNEGQAVVTEAPQP